MSFDHGEGTIAMCKATAKPYDLHLLQVKRHCPTRVSQRNRFDGICLYRGCRDKVVTWLQMDHRDGDGRNHHQAINGLTPNIVSVV